MIKQIRCSNYLNIHFVPVPHSHVSAVLLSTEVPVHHLPALHRGGAPGVGGVAQRNQLVSAKLILVQCAFCQKLRVWLGCAVKKMCSFNDCMGLTLYPMGDCETEQDCQLVTSLHCTKLQKRPVVQRLKKKQFSVFRVCPLLKANQSASHNLKIELTWSGQTAGRLHHT